MYVNVKLKFKFSTRTVILNVRPIRVEKNRKNTNFYYKLVLIIKHQGTTNGTKLKSTIHIYILNHFTEDKRFRLDYFLAEKNLYTKSTDRY